MKTIFLAVVAAALMFTTAFAQDKPARPAAGRQNVAQLYRQLKLTDEQKKSVEKLQFDLNKKRIDQEARLKTSRLELVQLFRADNPDQSAVDRKLSEISQLQSQQRILTVDHWFAVNKLLTPDQQKVWKRASAQLLMQNRMSAMRARAARFSNRFRRPMQANRGQWKNGR